MVRQDREILLRKTRACAGWICWPVVLLLLLELSAGAAVKTWSGSSSGNWTTSANWSGGSAPADGDDLLFPPGITRTNMTNNFSPNRARNSATFTGSNYVLSGSAIILTNGLRMGPLGTANNLPFTRNDILAGVELRAGQTFVASNLFSRLALGVVVLSDHILTIDGHRRMDAFGLV